MEQMTIRQVFTKYVSMNVLGMIGISCYILADTFFIAQGVGDRGLTALNLAIPIYSFISGAGLMVGMGGATRFAISKSKAVFTQALSYGGLFALLFFLAGCFAPNGLATLLGADAATHAMTSTYLRVILLFAPMFLLNNIVICFVRNDGRPQLAMAAMVLGSLSNIILDYVFVFPLGMGMFGAALATGISPIVSLCILSRHFFMKDNGLSVEKARPCFKTFGDLSALGVSALITELSAGVVMILFNFVILNLEGNLGVAAYGIVANIALVVVAIFNGISQGIQPIVSSYYGAGQVGNGAKVLRYGLVTAGAFALIIYGVFFVGARPIVELFNKDGNLLLGQMAARGLRLYAIAFILMGINIVCAAYFSAVDRPKYAFLISMLRGFLVILPVAVVLSVLWGMTGVWLAAAVAEGLVLLVTIRLVGTMARNKDVG